MADNQNQEYDLHFLIDDKNLLKRFIKKVIRRSVLWLLDPFVHFQNEVNGKNAREIAEIAGEIRDTGQKLQRLQERVDTLEERITIQEGRTTVQEDTMQKVQGQIETEAEQSKARLRKGVTELRDDLGAVARQTMSAKWKLIDHLAEKRDDSEKELTCILCGYHAKQRQFATKETDCVFHGGHLLRYVCPNCDAVFGPTKFSEQSGEEIDEDYRVHYLGFSEGDSSEKEERAFFMLHPEKDKVYLNYGCGHWSKSLQNLREQGYQVYGYEPYSPDRDNPYMITSKEQLLKMRFDGIYSNDLLEHLLDPVQDLREMKRILKNADSKMSHSTACFAYKHEYTRFHTCFFLGKSVEIMAERAGLQIVDCCNDIEEKDFYCYVFQPKEEHLSLLWQMASTAPAGISENGVALCADQCMYGPYLALRPGSYTVVIELEGQVGKAFYALTAQCGERILEQGDLREGENRISFTLREEERDLEFVVRANQEELLVKDIYFR